MNEHVWQERVLSLAAAFGWRAWHVPMPVRQIGGGRDPVPEPRAAGLPDLVLMHTHPPRLIFAELKGDTGKLSAKQREFLSYASGVADLVKEIGGGDAFKRNGEAVVGVYVWFPKDEPQVEMILRSRVMT